MTTPLRKDDAFPGVAELKTREQRSGEDLALVAGRSRSNRLPRGAAHRAPYAIPATVVLIQTITHATEHQAQLMTILSQQGVTLSDLDDCAYGQQLAAKEQPNLSQR